MKTKNIFIYSKKDFNERVINTRAFLNDNTKIISICNVDITDSNDINKYWANGSNTHPLFNNKNVINLDFDDISDELNENAFTQDMAYKLHDFIMKNINADTWHIHCSAGQSRSYTVGLYVQYILKSYGHLTNIENVSAKGHKNPLVMELLMRCYNSNYLIYRTPQELCNKHFITLYDKYNNKVFDIDNELTFLDILKQIKQGEYEGMYFISSLSDKKIPFDKPYVLNEPIISKTFYSVTDCIKTLNYKI